MLTNRLPQQSLEGFVSLSFGVDIGKGRRVENFSQVGGIGGGYAEVGIIVIIQNCPK